MFSFWQVLMVMTAIVLFNILGNLFRIVMLVIFEILPENPAHDITGVLCLILYVLVPAYFGTRYLAAQTFKKPGVPVLKRTRTLRFLSGLNILLFLILIVTGSSLSGKSPASAATVSVSLQNGYTQSLLENKVTKLEKPGILIYIKPVERFYGTEHNPMICWVGSGYEFTRIKTKAIDGREVFTGTLQKGDDKIYAAWWFDSGTNQTINQFKWRWKAFKGEAFYLVNVNSAREKVLEEEVRKILSR
jgi:exosortase N